MRVLNSKAHFRFKIQDEDRILIEILTWHLSPPLAALPTSLNWDDLREIAIYHRSVALLAFNLQTFATVPPTWSQYLQQVQAKSQERQQQMMEILNKQAPIFQQNNLPVLLLKGVDLGIRLYPVPACRSSKDIDLLIQPADLQTAHKILTTAGFKVSGRYTHHINYISRVQPDMNLELHTAPINPRLFRLNSKLFWRNSNLAWGYYHLNNEWLLIYLCLHLALHHAIPPRLISLVDIYTLLRTQPLDWDAIAQFATAYRLWNPILFVLQLVRHFWAIDFPMVVQERMWKPVWFEALIPQLTDVALNVPGNSKHLFYRQYWLQVFMQPNWQALLRRIVS